ncbi:hypothetical protein AB6A40_000964 [Gnathostoma spinigerum]|uniref:Uncharacterized protein n=1 Tax=Gnathostoma spinigerum TaxID=75299 RepID=A0ABD6E348_9BILA
MCCSSLDGSSRRISSSISPHRILWIIAFCRTRTDLLPHSRRRKQFWIGGVDDYSQHEKFGEHVIHRLERIDITLRICIWSDPRPSCRILLFKPGVCKEQLLQFFCHRQ